MNASELAAMMRGGGEEALQHPMDPMAQAMELRDRFNRASLGPATARAKFVPGALCREQRGMSTNRLNPLLLMFWRWLDITDAQDRMLIKDCINDRMIDRLDCMTGYISERGNLIIAPNESWRLEVVEDET